jgi:hypothetical protein
LAKGLVVGILIESMDQFFKLFLSAHEKDIGRLDTAIDASSIEGNIPTQ